MTGGRPRFKLLDWLPETKHLASRTLAQCPGACLREDDELSLASIDSVLHIPRNTITLRINELPPDHPLMVMCHSGVRSTQVQAWLAENSSENAINLVGGISAWSEKIDQSFHNISFWFNAI